MSIHLGSQVGVGLLHATLLQKKMMKIPIGKFLEFELFMQKLSYSVKQQNSFSEPLLI